MVRFARVKGSHSKSSFNKVPEEASTWEELKRPLTRDDPAPERTEESQPGAAIPKKVESSWSEFEPEAEVPKKKKKKSKIQDNDAQHTPLLENEPIVKTSNAQNPPKKKSRKEKELEGLDFKRKKPTDDESIFSINGEEIHLAKFDGYSVMEKDAKRLHELREQLREQGKTEEEIFTMIKMERRKAERDLKSLKKSLCFHCRKGGHNLSDCPELDKKPEKVSGICFKCGSTEHRLNQCKSKSTTLEYATCFICNEKGHLSRNCTNNPRGLYPDGGGCKSCGDVTHYERDCPKKRKPKDVVSAKRIDFDDVEALDYDDDVVARKKPLKIDVISKRQNKIIKF